MSSTNWIENIHCIHDAYENVGGYIHELTTASEFSMIMHTAKQITVRFFIALMRF
jgi:hypothetical protein